MSQEWLRDEQQWAAQKVKTPWATKIDLGGVKIIDAEGKIVAKMVLETDQHAALAAALIVERVNSL